MRAKLELVCGSLLVVILIIGATNVVVKLMQAIGEALAKSLPR